MYVEYGGQRPTKMSTMIMLVRAFVQPAFEEATKRIKYPIRLPQPDSGQDPT